MKREIAELYSRGVLFTTAMAEWRDKFVLLLERIAEEVESR